MNEAFIKAVEAADASARYLNETELDSLKEFVASGAQRVNIVEHIQENATKIVAGSVRLLLAEQSQLAAPGGSAYPNHRMAACLRDIEIILRYVTYSFLAGDAQVLDERCTNGLKETYIALGVPISSVVRAIQHMKEYTLKSLTSQEDLNKFRELTIFEIRKLYPKQWVTIEITQSKEGFPTQGRVIFHHHNIAKLADKTKELNGDNIYTFFTEKINEKPLPLESQEPKKIVVSSEDKELLSELSAYFDRAIAAIL